MYNNIGLEPEHTACIGNLKFGEMKFGEMKRNTSNWSNFCILLSRAGLSASAGLSCYMCVHFIRILCTCTFYPRDAMLARVFVTATCLSLRPSVTSRYCVKMKKASVMISSPSDSPKILVF